MARHVDEVTGMVSLFQRDVPYIKLEDFQTRTFDTVGDGTGTQNAIGDYSDTGLGETLFRINSIEPNGIALGSFTALIGGAGQITAGSDYGTIPALTNGIRFSLFDPDDNPVGDPPQPISIHSNAEWGRYTFQTATLDFGAGPNYFNIEWDISTFATPVVMDPGFYFALILNDDFSGLTTHYFAVSTIVM